MPENATATVDPVGPMPPVAPLTRSRRDRVIAGVCGGLAEHLGLPVAWVRVVVVVLGLVSGIGLVFYAWLWIFAPDEQEQRSREGAAAPVRGAAEQSRGWAGSEAPTGTRPDAALRPPDTRGPAGAQAGPSSGRPSGRPSRWTSGWTSDRTSEWTSGWQVLAGVVLLGLAVVLGLQVAFGIQLNWAVLGPAAVVLLGISLAWLQLDSLRTERSGRGSRVASLVLGVLLVLAGIIAFAAGFVSTGDLWLSLAVAAVIIAGIAFVAAPWLIKTWRDAAAKSSALAVQTERAEIAAHLHDSVLQTLALIQRNASDAAAVARLARAQERDLRQYLYADPTRPDGNLADRLEDLAAAIEDDHGQPIEVVTVGTAAGGWLDPLLQASREAMLNAVRHAGHAGAVRVYGEARPDAVEVFVKDRGPGFDLASIPPDRLGIRESVIGRMERAGGTAAIDTGPEGTEVRLHLPVPQATREGSTA